MLHDRCSSLLCGSCYCSETRLVIGQGRVGRGCCCPPDQGLGSETSQPDPARRGQRPSWWTPIGLIWCEWLQLLLGVRCLTGWDKGVSAPAGGVPGKTRDPNWNGESHFGQSLLSRAELISSSRSKQEQGSRPGSNWGKAKSVVGPEENTPVFETTLGRSFFQAKLQKGVN